MDDVNLVYFKIFSRKDWTVESRFVDVSVAKQTTNAVVAWFNFAYFSYSLEFQLPNNKKFKCFSIKKIWSFHSIDQVISLLFYTFKKYKNTYKAKHTQYNVICKSDIL